MAVPSPRLLHIETPTHGRVLYDDRAGPASGAVIAFHGYGQSADDLLADVQRLPSIDRWRIVVPQALHRFYTRDQQKVVASWMTREDRELAVEDNVEYVSRVIDRLGARPSPLVCLGFSQGASMAYRAALLGRHAVSGVIALGGDIPPEVRAIGGTSNGGRSWPAVLIGAGVRDAWFAKRLDGDLAFLTDRGIDHQVVRYDGAHEWTPEFAAAAAQWLAALHSRTST
jgi:predicted esterase